MGICLVEIKIQVSHVNLGQGLLNKLCRVVEKSASTMKGMRLLEFHGVPMYMEVFHFHQTDHYIRVWLLAHPGVPHGGEEGWLKRDIDKLFIDANHLRIPGHPNIVEVDFSHLELEPDDLIKAYGTMRDRIKAGDGSVLSLLDHTGLTTQPFLALLTYLAQEEGFRIEKPADSGDTTPNS
jgi:hypothetical protein